MGNAGITRSERAAHWDAAYEARGSSHVSWFQASVATSLAMIDALDVVPDAAIVDVGGGASLLADALSESGFTDVSVLDVSAAALAEVGDRLGSKSQVQLINEDLLEWQPSRGYDLWHDRAVFHFLVDRDDRATYVSTLRSALHIGGGIVLATFAPDGPDSCSGLPVDRFDAADLMACLGPGFSAVRQAREVHITPDGAPQPFTWLAARRVGDQ